jgi:hypothetical protein
LARLASQAISYQSPEGSLLVLTLATTLSLEPLVENKSFLTAVLLASALNATFAARTAGVSIDPLLLAHAIHKYGMHIVNKHGWALQRNQAKGSATPAYWKFPKRSTGITIQLPARVDSDAFGAVSPTATCIDSRTEAARLAVVLWVFGPNVELFNCFTLADLGELMATCTAAHRQCRDATAKKRKARRD